MVVLYTAGICVFFVMLLGELASASESRLAGSAGVVFAATFVLNGYVWLMVMVPSIHHEAVCAAAFFLMMAVYYAIKAVRNSFAMTPTQAAVLGAALGLAFGSRLTAVVDAMFLTAVLLIGMHLNGVIFREQRRLVTAGIMVFFPILAGVALMLYNYARFGSIMEVGHKYGASIYSQHILAGHAMRYDHIPYNLWDYFFRIPSAMSGFPYLDMHLFILDVRSRLGPAYHLIHYNELAVSVFWMMPILLFAFAPLSHRLTRRSGVQVKSYWIPLGVVALQTLCTSLFMGSAARYAFDFLPFLTAMSFLGLVMLRSDDRSILVLVVFTAVLSTILGVALVGNAFVSYFPFIRYPSPWLR